MEEKSSYSSFIFEPFIFADWLFIMVVYAFAVVITNAVMYEARSDFSEQLKMSKSKLHIAKEEHKSYKLKMDHRIFLLRHHIQSLVQEISKFKVELDQFRPLASSLVPQQDRVAPKALGPVSKVPARVTSSPQKSAPKASGPVSEVPACVTVSPQKSASIASGPHRQVPLCNGARAPEQTIAVAFMSAVVAPSIPTSKAMVRNGSRSQEERSSFPKKVSNVVDKSTGGISSKEEKNRGGIHSKEENRGGRPLPGSSSFVREHPVDMSSENAKKLLSGGFLTLFMGNLSYRANDTNLKAAIEKRIPISVDQAAVAFSSDGRSRGCAFVTVRWSDYLKSQSLSNSQLLVQKFCDRLTGKSLLGRPVFVELACSQRRGG